MRAVTTAPLIGAGVSTAANARDAIDEALSIAVPSLRGSAPDLAIVFVSVHHSADQRVVLERLAERAPRAVQIGCTAEGVLATGVEVEDSPGLAVWLGHLPRVTLEPVRLRFERRGDEGMIDGLDGLPPEDSVFVLLADPFTFPTDSFVSHLDKVAPRVRIIGGMASGARSPGTSRLFFQGQVLADGAVGVVMRGDVDIATVVSQGCRPIGELFRVTKGEGNLLMELDGRPALRRLEELYTKADERDQVLMRRGVHVGLAIRDSSADLGRGDFVIRNVLGADQDSGVLAISDVVEPGQAVQFQVRDAESAREDLRLLLDAQRLMGSGRPAGALLFSCNGRGQRLFGSPNHDVAALQRAFGIVPVAGFFAQGEIGPVSGRNFLHGFTASIALFMQPDRS